MSEHLKIAKNAVVRVGGGRGFVVAGIEERRYVITAAHCLPRLPTPKLFRRIEEGTFAKIIGKLGTEPMVWAQLCFVDPMSDIAVLCGPDALPQEEEQYEAFAWSVGPVPIGPPPPLSTSWSPEIESPALLLALDGRWQPCSVQYGGRFVVVRQGSDKINDGMSGSPIINDSGEAIAVISTGGGAGSHSFNLNPGITDCVPRWLLTKMGQV
jgi:hypothetical protein